MPNNVEDDVDVMIKDCMKRLNWLIEQGHVVKDVPNDDISGEVECPWCKGQLKYHQSSYNGHRGMSCNCCDGGIYQE